MLNSPSGGAGHGIAATDSRLMSIGTVLNALREEFPDITISKIRFLESEGLVEPQRTPSGYRKFSARDVERLGHVLRMQRDHYLPLKVIREHLDAMERGEAAPLPTVCRQRDGESVLEPAERRTAARIGRAQLLAAAEIGEQELEEWESYGLITPLPDGAYEAEAVTVASLVAELGRFGIEPRHLRVMKGAADREAGLVDQVVAPLRRHRNPQTRAHAEARAKELAGLTVKLHAALVQTALGVRLP
ncbi:MULTISPECIES: MerR family transcriptional regulator [unclassified Streptomyces]|uniref:transcriptional regulator FtsR n=1 Tax=unclassified Streptomyces TaxID=2593676 RepID=UPI002365E7E1|nr:MULTISPECIES: MerR family transcriptional regulator [unclassified Streptomyces]MDF3142068.1 MerR family transcriptional regulator [Streptomyces sp. T21Q-yed]WDF36582.1 MerR family transcriptional regulator [Streptomyces sp. T12]